MPSCFLDSFMHRLLFKAVLMAIRPVLSKTDPSISATWRWCLTCGFRFSDALITAARIKSQHQGVVINKPAGSSADLCGASLTCSQGWCSGVVPGNGSQGWDRLPAGRARAVLTELHITSDRPFHGQCVYNSTHVGQTHT